MRVFTKLCKRFQFWGDRWYYFLIRSLAIIVYDVFTPSINLIWSFSFDANFRNSLLLRHTYLIR